MTRLLLALLLSLAAAPSFAATVYLRGGAQVSGTLLESGSREVVIQTPEGIQRISTTQIDHVDYGGAEAPAVAPALRRAAPAPQVPEVPEGYPPAEPPSERYSRRIDVDREEARHTLSIQAGVGVPIGRLDLSDAGGSTQRNGDWGPLLGIQYQYRTAPAFAVGLEADWIRRTFNDSFSSIPNAETVASGDSGIFLAFMKAYFTSRGSARPYILAGAGMSRTSVVLDAQPVPGFVWADTFTDEARRLVDDRQWAPAVTARLGADFFSGRPHVFGLELGWTRVMRRSYAATADGQNLGLTAVRSTIDFVTFAGRWGFSFGEGAP